MNEEPTLDRPLIGRQIKRAKKMATRSLSCRVGGDRHHWQRVKPDWESSPMRPMMHQCLNCTTIKRVDLDPKYGFIIGRTRYDYPSWFKIQRTEGDGTEALLSSNAVRAALSSVVCGDAVPIDDGEGE